MKYASFDSYISDKPYGVAQQEKQQTYTSRALGLLPVDLMEHSLQGLFQRLVLGTLVELAHKMSASF
jgi:hypothetical protein